MAATGRTDRGRGCGLLLWSGSTRAGRYGDDRGLSGPARPAARQCGKGEDRPRTGAPTGSSQPRSRRVRRRRRLLRAAPAAPAASSARGSGWLDARAAERTRGSTGKGELSASYAAQSGAGAAAPAASTGTRAGTAGRTAAAAGSVARAVRRAASPRPRGGALAPAAGGCSVLEQQGCLGLLGRGRTVARAAVVVGTARGLGIGPLFVSELSAVNSQFNHPFRDFNSD